MSWYQSILETNRVPDSVVRWCIRRLLEARLREERAGGAVGQRARRAALLQRLERSPLAVETGAANEQHYEVAAEFFQHLLGPRLKYSACLWNPGTTTLAAAEENMLALYCERAALEDGMRVLDLGCGWGSLSLWIAERYPRCEVLGISNSAGQRRFVEQVARERKLRNLRIVTRDMNAFEPARDAGSASRFDRAFSIEMFEHMRNYGELLRRISSWLVPEGRLFVHVFAHREHAYLFESEGAGNWMGRMFFTGGCMPSHDLLPSYQEHLRLLGDWQIEGWHYGRTAEAWLENLDNKEHEVRAVLRQQHGPERETAMLANWRTFVMACAELWNYAGGREWIVSHYLFGPRAGASDASGVAERVQRGIASSTSSASARSQLRSAEAVE